MSTNYILETRPIGHRIQIRCPNKAGAPLVCFGFESLHVRMLHVRTNRKVNANAYNITTVRTTQHYNNIELIH